jgi:hypothetical protein
MIKMWDALGKTVFMFDFFGQGVSFRVSRSNEVQKSCFGVVCTLIMIVTTAVFSAQRLDILINHGD